MKNQTTLRVRLPEICLPDTVFTPVPPATKCTPPPAGSTVSCYVSGVTCTEVSRTNCADPPSGRAPLPGLQDVKFLITFTMSIDIVNPAGVIVCQTSQTSEFFQTVTLCAPTGRATCCHANFTCGPCIALDDVVCCALELCLVVWTVVPPACCGPCPPCP